MKTHDYTRFLDMGTIGHNHLLRAAQKAFAQAEIPGEDMHACIEAGIRLLCMAWGDFPLNGALAGQIASMAGKSPVVDRILTPGGVVLAGKSKLAFQGDDDPKAQSLFITGDYNRLEARLESLADQNVGSVRQAVMLMGMLSRWEWLKSFLREVVFLKEPGIAELILPDILLANGDYEQAVDACEKLVCQCGISIGGARLAMAHAGVGNTDKAAHILSKVVTDNPVDTSALLLMDTLVFPARRDVCLPGKCVVSIYSYNKSDELEQTLESLLASDIGPETGDILVRVLINGSRDDSLAVAEAARERFDGTMDVVSLPVNVGAPAARNWLLEAAQRDGAEWIAFLDDDVLVPHDWLRGLAAGTMDFPDAGVWGCRVADAMSPSLTQHADGFLLSPEEARQQGQALVLQEPGTECLVPDRLKYRRYCASVTGCCHLFRVDTLVGSSGFDLQFSPSQFDDLDSDLRLLSNGQPAAYLGDVQITHLRLANSFIEQSEASRIQGENHRALLEARHGAHLHELERIQAAVIRKDLKFKRLRLKKVGLLS